MTLSNLWGKIFKVAIIGVICVIALLGSKRAVAAEVDYKEIDTYLEQQRKQADISNISIGIVKDGTIQYLQTYSDDKVKLEEAHVYPISSISKCFTALAARQLINVGALDENASVDVYLPDFKSTYQGKQITVTVGQLLRHTSGISGIDGGKPYTYNSKYSLAEVVQRTKEFELSHTPGRTYEYSNMNYILLGRIIEIVSHMPYEAYIQENILNPLLMKHTYPGLSELQDITPVEGNIPFYGLSIPVPYSSFGGEPPVSSGGFLSTAEDMCRFMLCYQQGGYGGEVSLINENSVSGWDHAKYGDYYDIYWTKTNWKPDIQFFHSGSQPGYSSSMLLDVDSGYGIVILTNSFDQIGIHKNLPTPWSMTAEVLSILTAGKVPEPAKPAYNYYSLIWLSCLLLGLVVYLVFMIRHTLQRIHKKISLGRKLLLLFLYFGLPILWVVLIPVLNDCSWRWLLVSQPVLNISLLSIMVVLAMTGIIKGIAFVIRLSSFTKQGY